MDTTDFPKSLRCPIAFPNVLQRTTHEFVQRLLVHPFLTRCGNGSVTMSELRCFLIQQGKYSSYFTRYLCALISQLDDSGDVLRLAGNLAEELGFGADAHNTPHSHIYADMLASFGIHPEQHIVYPETQALIDTMFMLCRQPGGVPGLGALCIGGEAVVPAIYARLIEGFLGCGVDIDQLDFFSTHVDCDDGHAETMYEIIARKTSNSVSSRMSVIQAGEIAINARLRFFDAISREIQ